MEMSKVNVKNIGGADLTQVQRPKSGEAKGPSFEESLSKTLGGGASDKAALASKVEKPVLKFSNHAVERMSARGITFSPEQVTQIEQAAQKALEKGAKETLVLTDSSALIVSLKNNTVVTVMDRAALKESVFTNIDATVFA